MESMELKQLWMTCLLLTFPLLHCAFSYPGLLSVLKKWGSFLPRTFAEMACVVPTECLAFSQVFPGLNPSHLLGSVWIQLTEGLLWLYLGKFKYLLHFPVFPLFSISPTVCFLLFVDHSSWSITILKFYLFTCPLFLFPLLVGTIKARIPYVFFIVLNPAPSIVLDTKLLDKEELMNG